MLEFSLVTLLFLGGIFSVVNAALWGVEANGVTQAAETGVLFAASAVGVGTKSNTPALASVNKVIQELQTQTMGTPVCYWVEPAPSPPLSGANVCAGSVGNNGCTAVMNPTVGTTQIAGIDPGNALMVVCAQQLGPIISVKIDGFARGFIPFGLLGGAGIPMYAYAQTKALTFQT